MRRIIERFTRWRIEKMNDRQFIFFLSILIGFLAGLGAVVIKNAVHLIKELLTSDFANQYANYLYFFFPAIGIFIALIFIRFVVRDHVGHGIPAVLFSISKSNGIIKRHNIFSSIITSTFTVGFGGSVGLEGPTVATGAAIGSNIGQLLKLNYKQITLLLGLASAAAMAAIFKSPIAAIIFAIEVIMIDLTMASLVPLLVASITAVLTSYFFLGQAVMYPVQMLEPFDLNNSPFYVILGVVGGLVSFYFTKVYIFIEKLFRNMESWLLRWLIGGSVLGLLIFLFPALYGEGYEAINNALSGDTSSLYNSSVFYSWRNNVWLVMLLAMGIILLKVIATSVTFGAGGIGGIFAPTLFTGAFTGLLLAIFALENGWDIDTGKFVLVSMGALIAGVLHAPLTAIFLIVEITQGYEMFVPLMITSTLSYATTRLFVKNSVYTYQLARRGELITHHKDRALLSLMSMEQLIEKNFSTVQPGTRLGELIKIVANSKRNIYPVVGPEGRFFGMVLLDDIRHIMFDQSAYDTAVENLMVVPIFTVDVKDSMEEVAETFRRTDKFNIVVLENGNYLGFISRANVFSTYRNMLKEFSDD